jgi:hypothetical protein
MNSGTAAFSIRSSIRFLISLARTAADLTDPQRQLLLEVAWEALEAGILQLRWHGDGRLHQAASAVWGLLLRIPQKSRVTNSRAQAHRDQSHSLPEIWRAGISVDTACSSSLVAVHLACQAFGPAIRLARGWSGVILVPGRASASPRAR